MIPRPNTEHTIELLKRPFLRLRQTEIREPPPKEVPGGIPPERSGCRERRLQRRPRQRQDEVEPPRRRRRERHPVFADVERKRLGRIRERHGAFAGAVDDHEEVDPGCDAGETTGRVGFGDEEAETRDEEHDAHEWEGHQQEIAPAESVDGVDRCFWNWLVTRGWWSGTVALRTGESEEPVDDTGAHGYKQCRVALEAGCLEDHRRVIRDDVYATELQTVSNMCRGSGCSWGMNRGFTCCINITKNELCAALRLRGTIKNSLQRFLPSCISYSIEICLWI